MRGGSAGAQRYHDLDRIVLLAPVRPPARRRLHVCPSDPPMDPPGDKADSARRGLDTHLDKALEKRGDVVVKRGRKPLDRKRPASVVLRPYPEGPLPSGGMEIDFRDERVPARIESPLGHRGLGWPGQGRAR